MLNNERIIVALDGVSPSKALMIAKKLEGKVWGFKINDLLFETNITPRLKKFGKVFADAKLHDIPSTVSRSVSRLDSAGADMITVHVSGRLEMLQMAKSSARSAKILGVTVLTSHKIINRKGFLKLISDVKKAKLDGVVSSAHELKYLKKHKLLKVVSGIRPKWYTQGDDQSRTATPHEAISLGADFLVIGRPIINSINPVLAVEKILWELKIKK